MTTVTRENTIVLFDVDGTLTPSRLKADAEMLNMLNELRKKVTIGFVGGSDLSKQKDQLGDNVLDLFDYCFAENGLDAYFEGKSIQRTSFIGHLGEAKYQKLVNTTLKFLSEIEIPVKRGTFIEFRNGMINVCPIGRSCSQMEREAFAKYDAQHKVRENLVKRLKEEFSGEEYNLRFVIGGQISIDVFPAGWDKTFALQFVKDKFETIHFFGDKTMEGGNDYEIFNHPMTKGHHVNSYLDTLKILKKLFF